jgi:hypothetical protein
MHRSTCQKPSCIRAYYGTCHGWASPYNDARPLYCQAAGCGRQIKAWCSYRAVLGEGENNDVVWAIGIEDPVKMRERREEEKKEYAMAGKQKKKKKKKKDKKPKVHSDVSWMEILAFSCYIFCCCGNVLD